MITEDILPLQLYIPEKYLNKSRSSTGMLVIEIPANKDEMLALISKAQRVLNEIQEQEAKR